MSVLGTKYVIVADNGAAFVYIDGCGISLDAKKPHPSGMADTLPQAEKLLDKLVKRQQDANIKWPNNVWDGRDCTLQIAALNTSII